MVQWTRGTEVAVHQVSSGRPESSSHRAVSWPELQAMSDVYPACILRWRFHHGWQAPSRYLYSHPDWSLDSLRPLIERTLIDLTEIQ